jgi:FSR family fosmidomycin resistance protein-like MFS transporter
VKPVARWGSAGAGVRLAALGFTHAAVDGACAALLFGAVAAGRIPAGLSLELFLAYNVLAFALQPAFGWLVDALAAERLAAVTGALATAFALPLASLPGCFVPGLVLAGAGNAIFHVGGGSSSLRQRPGSAAAPGLFVAPGAAGLALGTLWGRAGGSAWLPVALLGVGAAAVALLPTPPAENPARPTSRPVPRAGYAEAAAALVLLVIAARSFTGFALSMPWKAQLPWLAAYTAAVVLGKAAGGVLADGAGRARVAVGALAFSAPVLVLAPVFPIAGVLGMFAFNMTMPVTLVALSDVVPEHPGFAFGLASLAIVAGAFPVLAGWPAALSGPAAIAGFVWLSAAILGVALWMLSARRSRIALATLTKEVAE